MNPAAEAIGGARASAATPGRRAARPGEGWQVVGDELVMDRFRLLERIGSGGMGTVYRAFDERLQRQVAVKEVASGEPERVAARGPGGGAAQPPRDRHPVRARRARRPRAAGLRAGPRRDAGARCTPAASSATATSAEIGADLCDALAHAHARGVVHRDVKPENVIVRDDQGAGRRAKLMDFGIARIAGAPTLTADRRGRRHARLHVARAGRGRARRARVRRLLARADAL